MLNRRVLKMTRRRSQNLLKIEDFRMVGQRSRIACSQVMAPAPVPTKNQTRIRCPNRHKRKQGIK
jgi:hypothetical protein